MKTLIMTVGLPRSGKSTWARTQRHPIVNGDSIRLALHGQPYVLEAEPMVSCVKHLMVKALLLAGHDTVILDGTHTTQANRDRWLSPDWDRVFITFGGPEMLDVCLERALKTCIGRKHVEDLTMSIRRMARGYERPTSFEKTVGIYTHSEHPVQGELTPFPEIRNA